MKQNPFLVAGLVASLFFIVNCNSSGSHSIKAAMPAKKIDTSKLPPCTPGIVTLASERQKQVDDLNKKYNDYKKLDLDSAKKAELNTLIDNLRKKSNEVYTAIRAIKGNPEGCNAVSSDNKKSSLVIDRMKLENSGLGKKVAELTGQSNILANSSEENDLTTLIEHQSYSMKSELARVMTTAKVGNMYLMDGKIFEAAGVADDLKAMKEKKDKTFCYLEASIGEITSAEQVRIIQITQQMNKDNKSASANIRWVANGDQLNSFSCNVVKHSDVPTELRKVFGDLITLKNGVGTAGEAITGD